MDEDDPEAPGEEAAEDDGFFLMEGWMFGALMYPAVVERMAQLPPANDNVGSG